MCVYVYIYIFIYTESHSLLTRPWFDVELATGQRKCIVLCTLVFGSKELERERERARERREERGERRERRERVPGSESASGNRWWFW